MPARGTAVITNLLPLFHALHVKGRLAMRTLHGLSRDDIIKADGTLSVLLIIQHQVDRQEDGHDVRSHNIDYIFATLSLVCTAYRCFIFLRVAVTVVQ